MKRLTSPRLVRGHGRRSALFALGIAIGSGTIAGFRMTRAEAGKIVTKCSSGLDTQFAASHLASEGVRRPCVAIQCTKLMVIRHAEKPDKQAGIFGVTEAGVADQNELSVRGWQRAGALVRFFNPLSPADQPALVVTPDAIFAASPTLKDPSKRSLHTVTPLAADLGFKIRTDFELNHEKALIASALTAGSVVLICWHHRHIPNLASELGIEIEAWPDGVFDRVLVFERVKDAWTLHVLNQRLLPGDS